MCLLLRKHVTQDQTAVGTTPTDPSEVQFTISPFIPRV